MRSSPVRHDEARRRAAREPVDFEVDIASSGDRRTRLLLAGLAALLVLPLVVGVVAFRRPTWTPVLDLAMTELRVRDVGSADTPLIGLPGRIGTVAEQGSHPGPISFYVLAPVYRLLGSTSWALQVATVALHAAAIVVSLLIARRRAGSRGIAVVAAALALLTAGYGAGALTEPWNPYMPLLWWVVFLLAVWSVACGDLAMLPVAVGAGSFCAQTHIPYLGLVLGIGALAVAATLWQVRVSDAVDARGRVWRWGAMALAAGVVLWIPPTIDQLVERPGNYRLIGDHIATPSEDVRGIGTGVSESLEHLDLWHLVARDVGEPGGLVRRSANHQASAARGAVVAALWGAAAAATVLRVRRPSLVALHGVVALSLLLSIASISRIFGTVWYYLTLWGWAVGVLAAVAIGWTALTLLAERRRQFAGTVARAVTVGLVVVTAALTLRFAVAATDPDHADATVAAVLAELVPPAADAIEAGAGDASGRAGRYLVTWSDALHIGSQGFGLVNELERRGFDVGVLEGFRVPATEHRVLDPADATARVHLASGGFVETWAEVPGAVEIAAVDPRSPEERTEYLRLREAVIEELRVLGLDDVVERVDFNLFGAAIDERVPERTQLMMGRMIELGAPTSIFVLPPGAPLA